MFSIKCCNSIRSYWWCPLHAAQDQLCKKRLQVDVCVFRNIEISPFNIDVEVNRKKYCHINQHWQLFLVAEAAWVVQVCTETCARQVYLPGVVARAKMANLTGFCSVSVSSETRRRSRQRSTHALQSDAKWEVVLHLRWQKLFKVLLQTSTAVTRFGTSKCSRRRAWRVRSHSKHWLLSTEWQIGVMLN